MLSSARVERRIWWLVRTDEWGEALTAWSEIGYSTAERK